MSKERQRARAARQQARRLEVEAAAAARSRQRHRTTLRSRLAPALPRRRRRFGALPTKTWAQLVTGFAAVQVLAWVLLPSWGSRTAFAVLTAACLAVLVTTRRRPPR